MNGLHVHVGVESADRCYERLEAVLPWLPVVLALSVNSPFVDGATTGMLSNRVGILAELPRAGAPPAFAGYDDWEAWVERLVELGVIEDHTRIWWDIRPHPRLGTLEIRIADQPTALERTALIIGRAARRSSRTRRRARADRGRLPPEPLGAASHRGLDAELHPSGRRPRSSRRASSRASCSARSRRSRRRSRSSRPSDVAADLVARTVA